MSAAGERTGGATDIECCTHRSEITRLTEALKQWQQAVWTLYGEPNATMVTMCCRVCHQCRTIYPGTNGDPIIGEMRHGFGCWAEPLISESQRVPFEIDHDSTPPTERPDRCPTCEGTGIGRKPALYVCGACGGSGLTEQEPDA